jgi:hypothetical protein
VTRHFIRSIKKFSLTNDKLFEEVKVVIHNSALAQALLYELDDPVYMVCVLAWYMSSAAALSWRLGCSMPCCPFPLRRAMTVSRYGASCCHHALLHHARLGTCPKYNETDVFID